MYLTCFIILNNMKRGFMKNIAHAFTLAEVMIVLVVIGILTGILVPAAMNSMPNENIMKFKKAHNTLYKVINELVSSPKYYADGDLGLMPNGNLVSSATYFCETFADVVSTKSINCSTYVGHQGHHANLLWLKSGITYHEIKLFLDHVCGDTGAGEEIVFTDGVVFYQTSPDTHFGTQINGTTGALYTTNNIDECNANICGRYFKSSGGVDENYYTVYKPVCIDIDGIGIGEEPFGYGIRADGKIITGARADEWLQKSIQEKE